jgi:hypothetical protein
VDEVVVIEVDTGFAAGDGHGVGDDEPIRVVGVGEVVDAGDAEPGAVVSDGQPTGSGEQVEAAGPAAVGAGGHAVSSALVSHGHGVHSPSL